MFRFLTRLWHWFKQWFNRLRPTPPAPVLSPTRSDLDYENCLMALLEEAEQGRSWGHLQGLLICHHLSASQLTQWLKSY
ncbi:MAG: hypothetical protein HC881_03990, partial [Leptolyngbyaceae cyanobacterium SL_7_1]|nr:hypothetical protein [Leptolyngbyaceae cyanobacterium SL_7_1]